MSIEKKLICSIIEFLNNQKQIQAYSPDQKESIEVAIQCLEAGFEVDANDDSLKTSVDLLNLFREYVNKEKDYYEDPIIAEHYKQEANELMKQEKFKEAVDLYSKAIEMDGGNSVYYCNRAAAYSKLGNHSAAVQDCKKSLEINPDYSKAYGRLGLAYTNMNQLPLAVAALKKALELEPDNLAYQTNLKVAEERLKDGNCGASSQSSGFDLSSLLTNSTLLNMATQIIQDPNMHQIVSGMMSGNLNQSPGDMNALLEAGQRLASYMQNSNPDFVNLIRQQMQGPGQNNSNPGPTSQGDGLQ